MNGLGSKWLASATLVLLVVAQPAWSGTEKSGGGDVVLCPDGEGGETVELLDLHEARVRYKYPLEEFAPGLTTREILWKTYVKPVTSPYSPSNSFKTYSWIMGRTHFQGPVPNVKDEGKFEILPGCRLQQIAIFHDDTETIDVDKALYSRLDNRGQAALLLHEIKWHGERKYGVNARNSEGMRKLVAKHFSVGLLNPIRPPALGQALSFCWASWKTPRPDLTFSTNKETYQSNFMLWNDGGKLRISFDVFLDRVINDDTSLEIPYDVTPAELEKLAKQVNENAPVRIRSARSSSRRPRFAYEQTLAFSSGAWEGREVYVKLKEGSQFQFGIDGQAQQLHCGFEPSRTPE